MNVVLRLENFSRILILSLFWSCSSTTPMRGLPSKVLKNEVLHIGPTGDDFIQDIDVNTDHARPVLKASPLDLYLQVLKPAQLELALCSMNDQADCHKSNHKIEIQGSTASNPFFYKKSAAKPPLGFKAQSKINGPTLLYFYSSWDSDSLLINDTLLQDVGFQRPVAQYNKMAINVDEARSWGLKSKYNIENYPVMILINSKGKVLMRIEGYYPSFAFERHLAGLKKPLDQRKILKKLEQAEINGDDQAIIKILHQLIKKYPKDIDYSSWVYQLLAYEGEGESFIGDALRSINRWTKLKNRALYNLTKGDLYQRKGHLLNRIGRYGDAQKAFRNCSNSYGALKSSLGAQLEITYCLHKSGKSFKAAERYQALKDKFPQSFIVPYEYARLLHYQKKFHFALEEIDRALKLSYGDLYLRALGLKVKIMKKMGRGEEARKIVDSVLSQIKLPRDPRLRVHTYVQELRRL